MLDEMNHNYCRQNAQVYSTERCFNCGLEGARVSFYFIFIV